MLAFAAGLPLEKLLAQPSRFTLLRRNVGFYSNSGGTIGWLISADSTVVVDSQYADQAADCLKGIQERRDAQVDALFNTHHHGDHTGGNTVIGAKKIIAQERVPELQKTQGGARASATVATTLFTSSWKGTFGDESIEARHVTPAHTGGDSIIHFQNANIAHMGDLVFNRVYPFIDRQGGASVEGWITTLETALTWFDSDTLFILGHGNPAFGVQGKKADLVKMKSYLSALVDHVEKGIRERKSREEITTLMMLPGFEDYVSFGPRLSLTSNLQVVYDELTA
jgi:cyclase